MGDGANTWKTDHENLEMWSCWVCLAGRPCSPFQRRLGRHRHAPHRASLVSTWHDSPHKCVSFLCVSLPSGHFKVRHESVCFHASFVYRPVWRMQPVQLRVENSGNYSAHVGTGSMADQRSWSVDNIKIKNWEELGRVRADELWVMLTHMSLSLHSTCFVLRLTTGWWVTCHVSQRMLI